MDIEEIWVVQPVVLVLDKGCRDSWLRAYRKGHCSGWQVAEYFAKSTLQGLLYVSASRGDSETIKDYVCMWTIECHKEDVFFPNCVGKVTF